MRTVFFLSRAAVPLLLALALNCGGSMVQKRPAASGPQRASAAATSTAERIDKFNRNYVTCRAKADFEREEFRADFRKAYFIQDGTSLVNTLFVPINDSSHNLMMIEVVGDNTTFLLSIPYMEKTAYMRNIVTAMQHNYHCSEDSAVAIIGGFNGTRPMPCPVVSLPGCEYVAQNLLRNVLGDETIE